MKRQIVKALRSLVAVPLLATLAACSSTPVVEPEPAPPQRSPEDVKLTLNLPADNGCACVQDASDRTFLERGMESLAEADYIEAVQYFQRYQRLESDPLAQWEAELAIAYVSMLPSSPFYDVEAAREGYVILQSREPDGRKHPSIVLMQQALESFVLMERHVEDLERRATMLQDDLSKREQALKRLRELTLGQPEGAR
jgi:tetratricopeptide (TPR) repeat protein